MTQPALFTTDEMHVQRPGDYRGAELSPCGSYRYRLWRTWDPAGDDVVFVMLNPSTADALEDDPTIRRCIDFAKREGYGGLSVVNLYAWRATDPDVLDQVGERAVGERSEWLGSRSYTDVTIEIEAAAAAAVIVAWGARTGPCPDRPDQVLALLRRLNVPIRALAERPRTSLMRWRE